MKPEEVFNLIKDSQYKTVGDNVDYCIYVNYEEERVYLIFEESHGKRDWQNNYNFPAKVYKNQKNWFLYHRGWGNAWKSCNDIIINELIDVVTIHPGFEIEVCGWSYGGAITPLAVEDFSFRTNLKVDYVETFGAPKGIFGLISKRRFRKCAENWKMYTLPYDLVTIAPPFPGYCRPKTTYVDKKNAWKLWRLFNPRKWHTSYDNSAYYE